jgi:hypothetical protein
MAARELDLDLTPELVAEVRVPPLEKVENVSVKVPPPSVLPVKWSVVGKDPAFTGGTGLG